MANKVTYGLSNVYLALLTDEATPTYDTPVAIPGAVNLTMTPEGGQSTFYADNIAYHVVNTNNGYTGSLEAALIPDAVLEDILGWEVDENGVLQEVSDAVPTPFALLCQFQGDDANRRVTFYKCTASRPAVNAATTTETADPQTGTLDVTITPILIDEYMVVKGTLEYSAGVATEYNAWFDAVLVPSFVS